MSSDSPHSRADPPPTSPFSWLDFLALLLLPGVGQGSITCVIPLAESIVSLSSRNSQHASASSVLEKSAEDIAVGTVGVLLSVVVYFCLPSRWHEGRRIYVISIGLFTVGNAFYLAATVARATLHDSGFPLYVVYLCRILALSGTGVKYTLKVRVSKTISPQRRPLLFLYVTVSSLIGLATGPFVVSCVIGLFAAAGMQPAPTGIPIYAALAVILILLVVIALVLAFAPEDKPVYPDEVAAKVAASTVTSTAAASTPPTTASSLPRHPTAPAALGAGAESGANEATRLLKSEPPKAAPALPSSTPTVQTTAIIQATCLFYGITRQFVRYSFESAMVVVYHAVFHMSISTSGLVASSLAYSSILAILFFRVMKNLSAAHIHSGVVLADILTLIAGVLLVAAGHTLAVVILTAFFIYPSVVIGAALSNSHPVKFQQPKHPLLNVEALLFEQELVQSAFGPALGLYFGRLVLGEPPSTDGLGLIYCILAALQMVIITLGWNPEATARFLRNNCLRREDWDCEGARAKDKTDEGKGAAA